MNFLFGGLLAKITTIVTAIALTAGIGSTVSTVSKAFGELDSDKIVTIIQELNDETQEAEKEQDEGSADEKKQKPEAVKEPPQKKSDDASDNGIDKEEEVKAEEEAQAEEAKKAEEEEKAEEAAKKEAEEKAKKEAEEAAAALKEADNAAQKSAENTEEAVENAAGGKVEVSRQYYEDCGSDTGYWEIVYSDGSVEYVDD